MEPQEIKEVFNYLEMRKESLTPYQTDFIRSMKKYYRWKGCLSSRQMECLLSLKEYLVGAEV